MYLCSVSPFFFVPAPLLNSLHCPPKDRERERERERLGNCTKKKKEEKENQRTEAAAHLLPPMAFSVL